jgi:hypothetical protein
MQKKFDVMYIVFDPFDKSCSVRLISICTGICAWKGPGKKKLHKVLIND